VPSIVCAELGVNAANAPRQTLASSAARNRERAGSSESDIALR
jgi:hypothetical protein